MALIKRRKSEEGYTLVETLVAMAIFVSVLIPLVATIGNFFLDHKAERLQMALAAAETEMSRTIMEGNTVEATTEDAHMGFMLRREIQRSGAARDLTITVAETRNPGKILVVLHKTVFCYEQ